MPVSSTVHVCVEGEDRIIREGVKLHRFRYEIATGTCHGLLTTTPEVTFAHLAREVELVSLVAIGDSLVRTGRTTPSRLIEAANEWPGQHRRLIAVAAGAVRSEVDSPQETRTRLLITLAGLPEPECNIVLVRYDGSVRWRLDMGYRDSMIAIEFDGAWHRDPAQGERDRQRREALTKQGWEIIVITARDLHEHPEAVLMQVRNALAVRGRAAPKRLSDRWRRHFTVPLRVA